MHSSGMPRLAVPSALAGRQHRQLLSNLLWGRSQLEDICMKSSHKTQCTWYLPTKLGRGGKQDWLFLFYVIKKRSVKYSTGYNTLPFVHRASLWNNPSVPLTRSGDVSPCFLFNLAHWLHANQEPCASCTWGF